MRYSKSNISEIHLPLKLWLALQEHCLRKLSGPYLAGEAEEPKAFGLIGGNVVDNHLLLEHIVPLKRNARHQVCNKQFMDGTMSQHAVPSVTPLSQRGWVADPDELNTAMTDFQNRQIRLVGTYHMHRVAWEHDQIRDTPTKLDTILGEDSRIFMFIISMVEPDNPRIRAFFEGNGELEATVIIQPADDDQDIRGGDIV